MSVKPVDTTISMFATESVPYWEFVLAWILKAIIALTALAQFVRGEFAFGFGALLALGVVLLPAKLAQNRRAHVPVEIEILLVLILVSHLTFGLLLDFYTLFDHYDKLLHYGNSVLIGLIGFLAIYAMYFTGRLRASPLMMGIVILLVTLGIGACWEILEYGSDQLLYGKFPAIQMQQGSPTQGPLDDTMWDLILDLLGGLMGATLGVLYIRYSKRTKNRRFVEVMYALGRESLGEQQG